MGDFANRERRFRPELAADHHGEVMGGIREEVGRRLHALPAPSLHHPVNEGREQRLGRIQIPEDRVVQLCEMLAAPELRLMRPLPPHREHGLRDHAARHRIGTDPSIVSMALVDIAQLLHAERQRLLQFRRWNASRAGPPDSGCSSPW